MMSLMRASGSAVIAFLVLATGALAQPQAPGQVQLAAAKTQSTAGHKTIQPVKQAPRKKSRCYG